MNEPKPKRVKKQYDDAFRRQAVALVESSGRPLSEIAAELGVTHWNLRDWMKMNRRPQGAGAPDAAAQELAREVGRLRKENESLRAQRDILKKALGIVSEPAGSASRT